MITAKVAKMSDWIKDDLKLGEEHEVDKIEVGSCSTTVRLVGKPVGYNSVYFDFYEEGKLIDIYSDERFKNNLNLRKDQKMNEQKAKEEKVKKDNPTKNLIKEWGLREAKDGSIYFVGRIYNDDANRFADGTPIRTSSIRIVDFENGLAITKSGKYHLEKKENL